MILSSIRWRIQLWHGLILMVVVAGLGLTAYQFESTRLLRGVDEELAKRNAVLTSMIPPPGGGGGAGGGRPPGEERPARMEGPRGRPPGSRPPGDWEAGGPPPDGERGGGARSGRSPASLFGGGAPGDYYYVVWTRSGRMQASSSNAPPDIPSMDAGQTTEWQTLRTRGIYRECIRFTAADRTMLTGRSIGTELAELRRLRWWLAGAAVGVLSLGLAGGAWLASRAIRPIDDISNAALRIASGDLSQRVPIADPHNELGRLAAVLNSTFDQLEQAFAQQARFTADAAHELRTPVAVLLANAQNGLAEPCPCASHQAAFEASNRAATRMRGLIRSLLDLARLDAGHAGMECSECDLAGMAEECVELVRPLAAPRRVAIRTDLKPALCDGDGVRLAQVVTNLLVNAVHYNVEGGNVEVSTGADADGVTLRVVDTGIGISAADLPHIFERFYRADRSRSRAEGRTGLGLAICKAIVDAHKGTLTVESQLGKGSSFTLRLPSPGGRPGTGKP